MYISFHSLVFPKQNVPVTSLSWNYGLHNSICSSKESFIYQSSFVNQIILWWSRLGGKSRPSFFRIHIQNMFSWRHCCHKRIYLKQVEWNGENVWKRQKYWKVSITLMYLTLKMYITSLSLGCLNMYHLVSCRLEQFAKWMDWMGFYGFSIIFGLNRWTSSFQK